MPGNREASGPLLRGATRAQSSNEQPLELSAHDLARSVARQFTHRAGELDLLYINNEQEGELECHRGFRRLFLGQIERSRADAIADHAILANQPDGEYASANYEDCSIWRWVG